MSIVGGLDIHRRQLTYDHVCLETGEIERGKIVPGDREHLRAWLARFTSEEDVEFAVEGCTGWRYVVEELARAEIQAHLADPAELSARKGPKRRAKTDRVDARQLRELLSERRIPESWIAPEHVLEARAWVRLYKDLLEERTGWGQRVRATLFHQGVPYFPLTTPEGRERLEGAELSPSGRQRSRSVCGRSSV